jgi:hypothetical protein
MLTLNPRQHRVVEGTHLDGFLAREFPGVPLFVFRNDFAGVWEIGEWLGANTCIERCIIGKELQSLTRRQVTEMRREMSDTAATYPQTVAKAIRRKAKDSLRETTEENLEFRDFMRFFCKRYRIHHDQMLRAFAGMD